jgi:hypothetical protein
MTPPTKVRLTLLALALVALILSYPFLRACYYLLYWRLFEQ